MSDPTQKRGGTLLASVLGLVLIVSALIGGMIYKTYFMAPLTEDTHASHREDKTQAPRLPNGNAQPANSLKEKTPTAHPDGTAQAANPADESAQAAPAKETQAAPDGQAAKSLDSAKAQDNKRPAGSLSRDDIMRGVKTIQPYVKACYEELLVEFPDAGGKVVMEFDIVGEDGHGRVELSELDQEKTTLFDSQLHDCMLEAIGDVKFDVPEGGGVVRVKYPFSFETEEDDED